MAFVVERQPFSGITGCFIHFQMVYFDDGVRWTPGYYWIPDADHPGSQRVLAPAYFLSNFYQPQRTRSGHTEAEGRIR